MKELLIGAAGTAQEIVDEHQTAAAAGSGDLPVFATPALVALMEQAACAALDSLDVPEKVGTLGGDDTCFIVMRDNPSAANLAAEILSQIG